MVFDFYALTGLPETGICHRPAARASKTHFPGLGPPWRSHPCIEGYPQCHRVRTVGMERSDRQHQPIADTQSRFTVHVTGLLQEPPKRIFRVWGRHGGPILVLRSTRSATGCVPWVWNDQTGNTNRLPIRRVDSPYMSPACQEPSKTHFSGLGPPWRSHPCIESYPQCHRVRTVGMDRSDRQHQPSGVKKRGIFTCLCRTHRRHKSEI